MANLLNRNGPLQRKLSSYWAWLAAALGVAVSLELYSLVWRAEKKRDATEFRRQVSSYLGAMQERRNASEDVLRILRALFHQNPNLSRTLFTNTVRELDIRLDGVQAIGWAPRVSKAQRESFEQSVREEGFPGFQIREGDLTHVPEN